MTCPLLFGLHQLIADLTGYGWPAGIIWRMVAPICGDF